MNRGLSLWKQEALEASRSEPTWVKAAALGEGEVRRTREFPRDLTGNKRCDKKVQVDRHLGSGIDTRYTETEIGSRAHTVGEKLRIQEEYKWPEGMGPGRE